ncbi:MAG: helix-turn-helix transcriptional regulator [Clostridia bacterium]|nr:helix-turn-helix transcriptional regulator [Clostridia bacterium]
MKKIIGQRISEYRKKKGLTQEELSEIIEISPHYMSALERGVYNIKIETLVKIFNALDCSADEIFCDVVKRSCVVKSGELSEKVKELPLEEQNKIFNVVETMIKNVKA